MPHPDPTASVGSTSGPVSRLRGELGDSDSLVRALVVGIVSALIVGWLVGRG